MITSIIMSCICQISVTHIKAEMRENRLTLGLRSGPPKIQRRGVIAAEVAAQILAGLPLRRHHPAEAAHHYAVAAETCGTKRRRDGVRCRDIRKRIGTDRAD